MNIGKYFWPLMLCLSFSLPYSAVSQSDFTFRTVASNLVIPWEIEYGPDDMLWVTERIGLFSRINPETGAKKVILDLRDSVFVVNETGLVGFCLHPEFPNIPYVYLTYVGGENSPEYRVVKRYEYVQDTLIDPLEIYRIAPAHIIHQGSRLHIGLDNKLYVTTGDHQQGWPALVDTMDIGKVLRMNLNGSVPDDNPVPGHYMWSRGHRNIQGFVQLPNGNIWTSEHGNAIEDEVNLIQKGGNYGWPEVEGPCDEQYEMGYCDTAHPINPGWSSGPFTVATCGLTYYNSDRYPEFKNSLLLATLKHHTLLQLQLNDEGNMVVGEKDYFRRSLGRIRDIAVSPDGRIFLCSSNREPNVQTPFPWPGDDRIVEVIPVPDTATPVFSCADTMFVRARPGDEQVFLFPLNNVGTAPFRVLWVGDVDTNSYLRSVQWRVPIDVLPQTTYAIDVMFSPPVEGSYHAVTFVATDKTGDHTFHLVGSTHVGRLLPKTDTLIEAVDQGNSNEIDVLFINDGTDTIDVSDAVLEGAGSIDFEIVEIDTGVLGPGDTCIVRVRLINSTSTISECTVRVISSSYRSAATLLLVKSLAGIEDWEYDRKIIAYPNPFHQSTVLVLPDMFRESVIVIHDVFGNTVYKTAVSGSTSVEWSGVSMSGERVATGTYVVTVSNGRNTSSSLIQYIAK